MKNKEHVELVSFPVFNYSLWVCYTTNIQWSRDNQKTWLGAQKKAVDKFVDGMHSYNNLEGGRAAIFFTPDSSVGTIAHEYFHALWRMFKYVGAKLENETFAYHLSYGLDRILDFKKTIDKKHFKNYTQWKKQCSMK